MEVDLYDGYYGRLDADPLAAVRRQTYGEDFGQASWTTPPSAGLSRFSCLAEKQIASSRPS